MSAPLLTGPGGHILEQYSAIPSQSQVTCSTLSGPEAEVNMTGEVLVNINKPVCEVAGEVWKCFVTGTVNSDADIFTNNNGDIRCQGTHLNKTAVCSTCPVAQVQEEEDDGKISQQILCLVKDYFTLH